MLFLWYWKVELGGQGLLDDWSNSSSCIGLKKLRYTEDECVSLLHILLLYRIAASHTDQKSRCTSRKCLGMDERAPKHWAKPPSAWREWNSQHIRAGVNGKTKQFSNRELCIIYRFPRKTSACSYKLEVHRVFCAGSNGFGMDRWWVVCIGNYGSRGSGVTHAACFGGV